MIEFVGLIEFICSNYDVDIAEYKIISINNSLGTGIIKLVTNANEKFIFKTTFLENEIPWWIGEKSFFNKYKKETDILFFLSQEELNIPDIIMTKNKRLFACNDNFCGFLSQYIHGGDFISNSSNLFKAGYFLSQLHSKEVQCFEKSGYFSWWQNAIALLGTQKFFSMKLDRNSEDLLIQMTILLKEAWEVLKIKPSRVSLIHGDAWSGNFKIYNDNVFLLDWETSGLGFSILDTANLIGNFIVENFNQRRLSEINEGINSILTGYYSSSEELKYNKSDLIKLILFGQSYYCITKIINDRMSIDINKHSTLGLNDYVRKIKFCENFCSNYLYLK